VNIKTIPIHFKYQIWLKEDVQLSTVLQTVEEQMALVVADQTCGQGPARRRLIEGVWAISAMPQDKILDFCDTDCHQMAGVMTLQTTDVRAGSCAVLAVLQDPRTLDSIVSSVNGVEAARFDESTTLMNCNEDGDGRSGEKDADPESSLGLGVGITAVAGAILVVGLFAMARCRQEQKQKAKDIDSIQINDTMLSSSPSSAAEGGVAFKQLEKDSKEDCDMEDIDLTEELLMGARPPPLTRWQEHPMSPDSVSSDDTEALIEQAAPVDLVNTSFDPCYQSCLGSPLTLTPIKEAGDNLQVPWGESSPGDGSVVQFMEGYVKVFKLSDLEAADLSGEGSI
jgi:hypothetical protein